MVKGGAMRDGRPYPFILNLLKEGRIKAAGDWAGKGDAGVVVAAGFRVLEWGLWLTGMRRKLSFGWR